MNKSRNRQNKVQNPKEAENTGNSRSGQGKHRGNTLSRSRKHTSKLPLVWFLDTSMCQLPVSCALIGSCLNCSPWSWVLATRPLCFGRVLFFLFFYLVCAWICWTSLTVCNCWGPRVCESFPIWEQLHSFLWAVVVWLENPDPAAAPS